MHGVEAFLKAINNSGDKEEMVERCVCSLRHITSRHPGAEMAQNAVREMNGIPMLMNLLQPQTRWPMIKVCMYVCMYVCMCVCVHACMYVHMYVCMYVCTCMQWCGNSQSCRTLSDKFSECPVN